MKKIRHTLQNILAVMLVSAMLLAVSACDTGFNDPMPQNPSSGVDEGGNSTESGGDIKDPDPTPQNPGTSTQKPTGVKFDLSGAVGFFIDKAATGRAAVDNAVLMRLNRDGTTSPAVTLTDDMHFKAEKILQNPATKELYLIGDFYREGSSQTVWVPETDADGNEIGGHYETQEVVGWHYCLIRVAEDGNWYGLEGFEGMTFPAMPFDKDGNFYFEHSSSIYEYSKGDSNAAATKLAEKAKLRKVLQNGTVVYTVQGAGQYIKPQGEKKGKLLRDAFSEEGGYGAYSAKSNVYYYDVSHKRKYQVGYDDNWDEGVENYTHYMVVEGYDFTKNKPDEFWIEIPESLQKYCKTENLSSDGFISENDLIISNTLCMFKIQEDNSLELTYNLAEKGYFVAENYVWGSATEKVYQEKILDGGKKIYFLGTRDQTGKRTLYKITDFGEPELVLKAEDVGAYQFRGLVSFAKNGDFVSSVECREDGSFGILSGNMESGVYKFDPNDIFESISDVVISEFAPPSAEDDSDVDDSSGTDDEADDTATSSDTEANEDL